MSKKEILGISVIVLGIFCCVVTIAAELILMDMRHEFEAGPWMHATWALLFLFGAAFASAGWFAITRLAAKEKMAEFKERHDRFKLAFVLQEAIDTRLRTMAEKIVDRLAAEQALGEQYVPGEGLEGLANAREFRKVVDDHGKVTELTINDFLTLAKLASTEGFKAGTDWTTHLGSGDTTDVPNTPDVQPNEDTLDVNSETGGAS